MCSMALADIPHSDDMMDDPFRYLGSHIAVKTATKPPVTHSQKVVKQQSAPERPKVPEYQIPSGASSATPSENSKRETLQTNATTPMTTPGITPGDTDKRFSEGGKRPSVATSPAAIKAGSENAKGHAIYSFLKDPLPSVKPQLTATKSLTHLPITAGSRSKQRQADGQVQQNSSIASNPDFNKSLPAIPKPQSDANGDVVELEPCPKEKSSGITRMFKTVRLARTQTAHEVPVRGTSTDQPQTLGHLQKLQSVPSPKKQKFSFSSMFQRRPAVNNKRVTVG